MDKLNYEVWIGFKNYRGDLYDLTRVASFCSRERAEEYLAFCDSTPDDITAYIIVEKC